MTEKEILYKIRKSCENAVPDRFSDIRDLIEKDTAKAISNINFKKKNNSFKRIAAAAAVFAFSVTAVAAANRAFRIDRDPEEYTHIAQADLTSISSVITSEFNSFSYTDIYYSDTVNTEVTDISFISDSITVPSLSESDKVSGTQISDTAYTERTKDKKTSAPGTSVYSSENTSAAKTEYTTLPSTYPVTTIAGQTAIPVTHPVTTKEEYVTTSYMPSVTPGPVTVPATSSAAPGPVTAPATSSAAPGPVTAPATSSAVPGPVTAPATSSAAPGPVTAPAESDPMVTGTQMPCTNSDAPYITYPYTTTTALSESYRPDKVIAVYYTDDKDAEDIIIETSTYHYTFFKGNKCILTVTINGTETDILLEEALEYFTPDYLLRTQKIYGTYELLENSQ